MSGSLLTGELRAFIGFESDVQVACEPVERGAVRRFAQAVMDGDPAYRDGATRYGGAIAPPLLPINAFRQPFGTADAIQAHADDPDFDGFVAASLQGLPDLPLAGFALLNGGGEMEFFRYARQGETIRARSRYRDIVEKSGRTGPFLIVVVETDYWGDEPGLILRATRRLIRRPLHAS